MIKTDNFLYVAFVFSVGCSLGWLTELVFRRFVSKGNKERKWINPGFLRGPWLPLYGFGLLLLFFLCDTLSSHGSKLLLFASIGVSMTALEYLAGIVSVELLKVRLWDYSKELGNVRGLICPKFSAMWTLSGVLYYYFLHPALVYSLNLLSGSEFMKAGVTVYLALFFADLISVFMTRKNQDYLTKR